MKICVIIRVYDRVEDLPLNLSIIKNTWKSFSYDVIVVTNGINDGFILTKECYELSDKIIELKENSGHLKGNSQLLIEGIGNVELDEYDYIIILEADTWIYTDKIIKKYVELLNNSSAVWASARWYDRFYSLATDFAIIKAEFLKEHKDIFDFSTYPECSIYNYLEAKNKDYLLIKENMNAVLPSYIKKYPYAFGCRFYVFPRSGMVTHHIEDLKNGMEEKKYHFNVIAKTEYFKTDIQSRPLELARMYFFTFLDKFFLRRSWYSKREKLKIVDD